MPDEFILAQNITETPHNKTETFCKTKEVKDASDQVFACFSANVNHGINNANPETKNYVFQGCNNLSATYSKFVSVANASCYNDTRDRNLHSAVSFVDFSTRDGSIKDFVANEGFQCIKSVKDKISGCLNRHIQVKEYNHNYKYQEEIARIPENFWKMSRLTIDHRTCMEARNIKKCVTRVVRSKCDPAKTHTINVYIRSLFEFMLENCPELEVHPGESQEMKDLDDRVIRIAKQMKTSIALLGVLLAFAILTFLYVCGRKCSLPAMKSGIKGVNERFSMSVTRRRSLVNEQVGQHQA